MFGKSEESEDVSYDEVGVKWVYFQNLGSDDALGFVSAWSPANHLQDHIQQHLATLDSQVVTLMIYDDEGPEFVGARLTLIDSGKLISFEKEIDTSRFSIVGEDEIEEEQVRLNEENSDNETEVVSWDEVSDYTNQCETRVVSQARKKYDWIAKDWS